MPYLPLKSLFISNYFSERFFQLSWNLNYSYVASFTKLDYLCGSWLWKNVVVSGDVMSLVEVESNLLMNPRKDIEL